MNTWVVRALSNIFDELMREVPLSSRITYRLLSKRSK